MSTDRGKKRSKPLDSSELPSGSKKKTEGSVEPVSKEKKRVKLTRTDLRSMTRDEIIGKWEEQDDYIEWLQTAKGMEEVEKLQETVAKLTQQVQEATRRENVLNMRLATKQQELQDTLVSSSHMNHFVFNLVCLVLFLCILSSFNWMINHATIFLLYNAYITCMHTSQRRKFMT